MDGKWILRLLSMVVVLAAVAGIGFLAFNAGVAQGIASKAVAPAGQVGSAAVPYVGWPFWFGGVPFFGFNFLGFFFGLFVLFLVFRLISFAFWGARWGHSRHMHGGWDDETGVPARFREWHERAHGSTQAQDKP